ncbi:head maturation protease, ClpP-related [Lactobacillus sp. ESL0677]|uniref:head maturation protease, ClpP-related n=1 Tax=Lactobacillus sp. ESL0677 TaxID=2983208 RepID=UPI0023F8F165|nr:head maturation protease, ClpP-related [Lactobacillus sp. ESL0677]WEV36221.1 Clp protease ClpP [Lactobacillus sp. ESL0677]
MKVIDIKGEIVDNDTAAMYNFFDMQNTNPKALQDSLNEADGDDVTLNISSLGGDVFTASEIYTMLNQYSGKVTGVIQGIAASAASFIPMVCDKIVMSPTALMMIHRSWTVAEGNTNDLNHRSQVSAKVDESIAAAYQNKTGKSQDEILQMMDEETWMTAEDAVKQGFADEVMEVQRVPQISDSLSTLPSKNGINKFKHMLKSTDDNIHSALFMQKLDILKGTN